VFTDRKQKVVVNNECSNPNTVKAGVPQGSVLGSLLFLFYINDITDNLGNLARLFADDTSKTLNQIIPPKSEYFFQQHWESEYFFRRKKT
jgi:hypothetical protein